MSEEILNNEVEAIDTKAIEEIENKSKMLFRIRKEFGLSEVEMSVLLGMVYDDYLHLEISPMLKYEDNYNSILKTLSSVSQKEIDETIEREYENFKNRISASFEYENLSEQEITALRSNDELLKKKKAMKNRINEIRASLGLD